MLVYSFQARSIQKQGFARCMAKIPAYHKFTARIPGTCCLEQVPWVQRLWILGKFKGLFSILGEDGEY